MNVDTSSFTNQPALYRAKKTASIARQWTSCTCTDFFDVKILKSLKILVGIDDKKYKEIVLVSVSF